MSEQATKSIVDVARELGKYSIDAFEFLRQGLDFTVRKTHGASAGQVRELIDWLHDNDAEVNDLPTLASEGKLPSALKEFLIEMGDMQSLMGQLNLHVGGDELCWGLRDLAQQRWGLMAPIVLRQWGIRTTKDFGRMVFALVDNGLLQKQPEDVIEDFENVYNFDDAFDRSYKIDLSHKSDS